MIAIDRRAACLGLAGALATVRQGRAAGADRAPATAAPTYTETLGGAGGELVRVTTLARSGEGSLDAAVRLERPRVIVFEVGGVIDLDGTSLAIRHPHVTIAGQTAPGPGITLIRGGVRVLSHDVVLQHLMVRPGDAGRPKTSGWEVDGVVAEGGAHDVIVENCSITWATDENLSATGPRFEGATPDDWRRATAHRITFRRNLIAEGLSNATHSKGEHSKGSLIHDNVTGVWIEGNLYIGNRERNPLFKGGAQGVIVNNYIYNPGRRFFHYNLHPSEWGEQPWQTGNVAIVGNVFEAGPATPAESVAIAIGGEGPVRLHAADNALRAAAGATPPVAFGRFGPETAEVIDAAAPAWPAGFTPLPSEQAADAVLGAAGARPWDRDPIDARILADVRAGGGRVIDSQDEVGGYPTYAEVRSPYDPAAWTLNGRTLERRA